MREITGKKYYWILFETTSPLAVGSGENDVTDKDILIDGQNHPYIPGTSMAGVYRSILSEEEGEQYFGKLLRVNNVLDESRVIVYDAIMHEESEKTKSYRYISKRDMVALNDNKVAIKGAKFDMQIAEPGLKFVTIIEENLYKDDISGVVEKILAIWKENGLNFGGKTMRGFGSTKIIEVKSAYFATLKGNDDWLNFDPYNEKDENWEEYKWDERKMDKQGVVTIDISLSLCGGISIREYSTDVDKEDYRQLTSGNRDRLPVIPGTSWAGAFRARMKKLGMADDALAKLWGSTDVKSGISFSESRIEGGTDVIYTRNAVDRFTNETVNGALYKEKTHYRGDTHLVITCKDEIDGKTIGFLSAAIMDLHRGYLAVGGLTAVGRGIFKINSITVNGIAVEDISYDKIRGAIEKEWNHDSTKKEEPENES